MNEAGVREEVFHYLGAGMQNADYCAKIPGPFARNVKVPPLSLLPPKQRLHHNCMPVMGLSVSDSVLTCVENLSGCQNLFLKWGIW